MPKYRLNHEGFKGIIVDAETKGEAIKKLIPLLRKNAENTSNYEQFFVNVENTHICISLRSTRLGSSGEIIGRTKANVEEVFEETLEKEKALEKEHKRITNFCAIPAKEICASDICDFFGEDWYMMTLYGQNTIAQHIADALEIDFKIAFEWLESILNRCK